jgi:hypothetical protein
MPTKPDTRIWTRTEGIDEPLAETRTGTPSFYELDALGSITSLSNSTGSLANTYVYDAFGNLKPLPERLPIHSSTRVGTLILKLGCATTGPGILIPLLADS